MERITEAWLERIERAPITTAAYTGFWSLVLGLLLASWAL